MIQLADLASRLWGIMNASLREFHLRLRLYLRLILESRPHPTYHPQKHLAPSRRMLATQVRMLCYRGSRDMLLADNRKALIETTFCSASLGEADLSL